MSLPPDHSFLKLKQSIEQLLATARKRSPREEKEIQFANQLRDAFSTRKLAAVKYRHIINPNERSLLLLRQMSTKRGMETIHKDQASSPH